MHSHHTLLIYYPNLDRQTLERKFHLIQNRGAEFLLTRSPGGSGSAVGAALARCSQLRGPLPPRTPVLCLRRDVHGLTVVVAVKIDAAHVQARPEQHLLLESTATAATPTAAVPFRRAAAYYSLHGSRKRVTDKRGVSEVEQSRALTRGVNGRLVCPSAPSHVCTDIGPHLPETCLDG